MKKAVIYTRVSSEEQVGNTSLDEQERRCKLFIESQGYFYQGSFREEGVSGADESRPALNRLFEGAENGEFDIVVFLKIDRLSRSLRLFHKIIDRLTKCNVQIQSVQESIDTSTPSGRMITNTLANFAEFERDMIRERSMMGRTVSMKKGIWHGSCPFGYEKNKEKRLVIKEDEAEYVRKMYSLFVNKDPLERMTLHKVQRIVNSWKISTKNPPGRKKVNGLTFWAQRTIGRILTNPVYIGEKFVRQYTKSTVANSVKLERPEGERIKLDVPAIIDKEVFELVQREFVGNKVNAKRNRIKDTMLARLMYCALCGRKYTPTMKEKERTYYYCLGKFHSNSENPCSAGGIKAERVEQPVWEVVQSVISNPDLIKEKVEELKCEQLNHTHIKDSIDSLQKKLTHSREMIERLLDLHLDGHIAKADYLSKVKGLDQEISFLNEKIMFEESKLDQGNELIKRYGEAKEYIKTVVKNLGKATYQQKIDIAHLLIRKVEVDNRNIKVVIGLPSGSLNVLQRDTTRIY